jgi:hypothetical protein
MIRRRTPVFVLTAAILSLASIPFACLAADQSPAQFLGKGLGQIQGVVVDQAGAAVAHAWVLSDHGLVSQTAQDGTFAFQGLSDGKYAVKALALGMEESLTPGISVSAAATANLRIVMQPSQTPGAIVSGRVTDKATGVCVPAVLEINDSTGPRRWFDVAGNPYGGRTDVPSKVWHQKNKRFWTTGQFAFLATPGELQVTVRSDGYRPLTLTRRIQSSQSASLEIEIERLFDPAALGWFKGDFHAHAVHGEKLYQVNIPLIAFILRAERYHWFYLSSSFNNDGLQVDNRAIACQEGQRNSLFLALNSEYPKTGGGHVGNIGIDPPQTPQHYPDYSNVETIKANIADQGGVAVPVHPLQGHMRNKELPFDLLGAPELIAGFDFYASWKATSENTWTMLLNRGYRLCRTATSDTAFDLGRTPGTMGATFIHPATGQLNRESIVTAVKEGKTTLSWDGALLIFEIDGRVCGEIFSSGPEARKATLSLHYAPGVKTVVHVTRNGQPFKQFAATVPGSGRLDWTFDLVEQQKAWYTAVCWQEDKSQQAIAASSPFYFGDWETPHPVVAKIEAHVFDADTSEPLDAEIALLDSGKLVASFKAKDGKASLDARVFHRLKASAPGHTSQEASILGTPAILSFISALSEDDLQHWESYEKAAELLKNVKIELPLKRK